MRRSNVAPVLALFSAGIALSCAEAPTQPDPILSHDAPLAALTAEDGVRISEIHYDNEGTDAGEAIEIEGPAGTDLSGWSLVLYNGSSSQLNVYTTTALSGEIPNSCEGRGVMVQSYPSNGIQNGSPDGVALVDATGAVIEFLSYEGTFQAVSGPATGMGSTDMGVSEGSSTPADHSLQRQSIEQWAEPAPHTFGDCNGADGGDSGGGGAGGGDEGGEGGEGGTGEGVAFLSELHYDNSGSDTEEAVEVAGEPGTDLSGWTVELYNGNNGASYGTIALTGTIPADCRVGGGLRFDRAGIQNGSPDGLALVDASGAVVEFISYEGTFTAVDGPAVGISSLDMGVSQSSSTASGQTLQRDAANGVWRGPEAATWGCGGDGDGEIGDGEVGDGPPVFLSEIRADQPRGTGAEEYFEVGGPAGATLTGLTLIVIGDGAAGAGVIEEVTPLAGHTLSAAGAFVAGEGTFTLGTADLTTTLNFENGDNPTYLLARGFTGSNGQDLDTNDDGVLDVTPWASIDDCVSLIEFLGKAPIYCDARLGRDVSFTPGHVVRTDDGWISATFTPSSTSDSPGTLEFDPATAVAGVIAPWGVGAPGEPAAISLSASFVRLPVGFNRALFVTVVDDFRDRVDGARVTFESSNPAVVTSDQFGNLTAQGVGETTLMAAVVGAEHVMTEVDVDVIRDEPSGVAYQDHLELGTPTDEDPRDDHLITRDEMALSYNATRGSSNWVSWNLDEAHIGSTSRCECYTPEPLRPSGAHPVVNFDYTGSGYSRGHITQSFNRTATLPDNAATYYTSNIMPQAAANNTGPWGSFENFTVDRARAGAEVWVIAGGEYAADAPTLKNEGNVAVPSWTWKVAVFTGRDDTLADIDSFDDLEVIAIRTPNRVEPGVDGTVMGISNDWRDYQLTVDEVEARIGYDLLDRLPASIEPHVESGFDGLLAAWAAAASSVDNGASQALGVMLEQADRHLQAGRMAKAGNRLSQFLDLLDVFEREGKVAPATAAALRAEAEEVLAVLTA